MKLTIIATILILLSQILNAQDFNRQKMDSLFALIDENHKGMGSVSVFHDGKEVYQNTIGWADMENHRQANHETKYRIGSISKTFTATIIMQLVEEKKLKLNTKLRKYFPDLPNAKKITIEQMLRHRSGLFNFTSSPDYTQWMEEPKSRDELLAIIEENGTVSEPGETAGYSNTNYVLLSFIAEDIEGKPFAEILQECIAKPCGLKNTFYGGKIDTEMNEAKSYTRISEWEEATETDMSIPMGAGAIISTPTDLNRFYTCLFSGKMVNGETLEMMMRIEDDFGIGMFTFPFHKKTAYGHNGGIDGFQSSAGYFPDEDVSVAYLGNAVVMPVNDIMIGVLSIYFGEEYDLPDFQPAMEISAEELKPYPGLYTSPDLPIDLTITIDGNTLMGQGSGQPAFPLEPYEKNKFRFDQAGLTIEFVPEENKLILNQGGKSYDMKRE